MITYRRKNDMDGSVYFFFTDEDDHTEICLHVSPTGQYDAAIYDGSVYEEVYDNANDYWANARGPEFMWSHFKTWPNQDIARNVWIKLTQPFHMVIWDIAFGKDGTEQDVLDDPEFTVEHAKAIIRPWELEWGV